jgi:ATPase family associated with various cellular activities (AAA)
MHVGTLLGRAKRCAGFCVHQWPAELPAQHPEVYAWLGVEPPRGLLLHGPPGCGKTALAHAIANQCGVPFLKISAPEIVSGMSGDLAWFEGASLNCRLLPHGLAVSGWTLQQICRQLLLHKPT